eukprot:GFUD01139220.1.p1 GENE.GFUD01139220.1~~GFUD01139220.1.p1  ORF type:complete len:549 (+),score=122.63 GFUD01139220.1:95-1741(+)
MIVSLILCFLVGIIHGRPQDCDVIFDDGCTRTVDDCDPVFDDNCKKPVEKPVEELCLAPIDPILEDNSVSAKQEICDYEDIFNECNDEPTEKPTPVECYASTNEIEDSIFAGDTRQAFNDCDPTSSCDKYAGDGYACAPSWTCHNNTIITDGKGLIDVRSTDDFCATTSGTLDASDSKCEQVDYVCCKNPNFRATKCTNANRRPKKCKALELSQCGRASPALKITGQAGNTLDAQPGEFPHMCVVYRFEKGQRIYVAGASLIAKNKVITVAHKFFVINKGKTTDWRDKTSDFHIRCGEHNVKTETELLDSQETQVEKIHLHPQYDAKRVRFNLAILQTKENFIYQNHVGPVCLPQPFQNFDDETNCWSSGWGADAYESFGQYSDALKKVKMPVVSSSECERRMKNTDRFKNKPGFRIHESWICIGGEEGSDTCKGDGGSPHVCKNSKNNWVQVGAVAWGIGCGSEVPAVYSSIPNSMCWIDWVMSCIPEAEYDIDDTFVENLDIRGTSVESKNKLATKDCGDWMQNNFDLLDICEVSYEDIDERIGAK